MLAHLVRLVRAEGKENEEPARWRPALCAITEAWLRFDYRIWGRITELIVVPITSPDTINSTRRFC